MLEITIEVWTIIICILIVLLLVAIVVIFFRLFRMLTSHSEMMENDSDQKDSCSCLCTIRASQDNIITIDDDDKTRLLEP